MVRIAVFPSILVTLLCAIAASASPAATLGVTSVTPTSGGVGTVVTVSGSGFGDPALGVAFNGVAAPVVSRNAGGTELKTKVPFGATDGAITVTDSTGLTVPAPGVFDVTYGATIGSRNLYRTQPIRILGSAFPPSQTVMFTVDGKKFGHADADGSGSVRAIRRLPAGLPAGRNHTLGIDCNGCDVIQLPFNLRGDWPQHRWGGSQTGVQPVEWELTPANVSGLKFRPFPNNLLTVGPMVQWGQYVYASTRNAAGGFIAFAYDVSGSTPVFFRSFTVGDSGVHNASHLSVEGGTLFVGWGTSFYAFDARGTTGCNLSSRICQPMWDATQNPGNGFEPVVSGGLLLNYAGGKLTAFDAAGVKNCSGTPKSCTPLWTKDGISGRIAAWPIDEGGNGNVFDFDGFAPNKGLYAFDRDGNKAPNFPVTVATGADSPVAIASGRLALIRDTNVVPARLTVYSALTGAQLWEASLPNSTSAAPAMTPTRIFVTLSDGQTLAFSATGCGSPTCNPLWSTPRRQLGASISPVVAGNVVFAAARLKATDGADTPAAYDANGVIGCSGTPKVCQPLWTAPAPTPGLDDHQYDTMLVAGGWLRIATRQGFTMYHR